MVTTECVTARDIANATTSEEPGCNTLSRLHPSEKTGPEGGKNVSSCLISGATSERAMPPTRRKYRKSPQCGRSSWEPYTCYGGGGPRAGKITIRHGSALENIIRTISFVNGNMRGRGCRFGLSMFPPHVGRHKGSGQATRPPQKTRSFGVEWTRTYAVPPTRVRLPRYLGKMGPQSGWVARRSCQALRSWELDPAPSEITRHVIFRHLPPAAPTTHWLGASTRKSRICSQEHDDQRKC